MGTIRRLVVQVRPYYGRIAWSVAMMFVGTALVAVQPMLIQQAVDRVFQGGEWALLFPIALAIVLATVVRAAINYYERISMEWVAQRTIYDLRNAVYRHLQTMSFSFYDKAETGQLMSRATADVETLRRFLSFGVLRLVGSTLTLAVVMVLLFSMNWRLTLVSLATMPVLIGAVWHFATRVRPRYRLIQEQLGDITNVLQEAISGVRVVRAYAQEEREIERFRRENQRYLDLNIAAVRLWAFYFPLMALLGGLGSTVILWYGGSQVVRGELTIGQMVAFQTLLMQLIMPIRMIGWLVNMATQASAAGQRVYEVLDTAPEVKEKPGAKVLQRVKGHVRFEDVNFSYDGKTEVLEGLSLDVPAGQTVALLGATGSGKSSIINLIPRFYDVTAGRVTVDGLDIRDVTLQSLRANIGIVLQETFLFSASLKDNIAYGQSYAKEADIIAAAKAARIHEFIVSLPAGYDTAVGERGVGLSGGQKQRVAIARALLMNPRILILDEATSSVDTQTEHLIQQALHVLMQNRTTFVVAQRLSTIKRADQIIVLKDGRVIQRGRHEELLLTDGVYQEIYNLQFRSQEDGIGIGGERPCAEGR